MNENIKYFKIDSKTLAIALNYCGFTFIKVGDMNKPIYSFVDTLEFRESLKTLNELRTKNNEYKNNIK